MSDKIRKWKETTWQILPRINMPSLDPQAVQFALFDSDPIDQYRKALLANRDRLRREIAAEPDSMQREILRKAQMITTWDGLFRTITGDEVYLLVPSLSKTNESLSRALVVSSNSPAGRKWLTTKIAHCDDAPTCWCLPINTEIGKSVEIELQKENVFEIGKLYHDLVETT